MLNNNKLMTMDDIFLSISGTRIIYERAFLLNLRNSPLSRTPPNIPTSLMKGSKNVPKSRLNENQYSKSISRSSPPRKGNDEQQFDMEL